MKYCLSDRKEKVFLHQVVTNVEKWIYFNNPKRKRSLVDPGSPFNITTSMKYIWREGFTVYLVG